MKSHLWPLFVPANVNGGKFAGMLEWLTMLMLLLGIALALQAAIDMWREGDQVWTRLACLSFVALAPVILLCLRKCLTP